MPSSHAQFACFFSTSLALFLLFRHQPIPHPKSSFGSPHRPFSFIERLALSVLVTLFAGCVALSRIYLNYHTPKQVAVGYGAGACSALAWFLVTSWLRRAGWVIWILDTTLAKLLRLRDLVVEEDLATAGWLRWEDKRRQTRTALASQKRQ